MFERFTEKARRVVFFARYEASQYGSPFIETEHLLLGVLREDKRFVGRLPAGAAELARSQIEALGPKQPGTATSVDLPLSNASKRVLVYAMDEADRLNHRHIGCEHLLVGLIHDKETEGARILEQLGVKVEQLKTLALASTSDVAQSARVLPPSYQGRQARSTSVIKLRGGIWDAGYVREAVRRCCEAKFYWRKTSWKRRDAVLERRTGEISLDLTLAEDSANFELVQGGWKKDLCAICRWELFESADDHGTGYFNGRDWLCTECYDNFWGRPEFLGGSFGDMT
ncbi:MAG: Clp protease N-terminal domain-containing protein [Candidatus Sulfotelmatobacter sp.]